MKTSLILRSIRPADYELSGKILILKTERNSALLIEALAINGCSMLIVFQIKKYNDTDQDLIVLKNQFFITLCRAICEYINLNQ